MSFVKFLGHMSKIYILPLNVKFNFNKYYAIYPKLVLLLVAYTVSEKETKLAIAEYKSLVLKMNYKVYARIYNDNQLASGPAFEKTRRKLTLKELEAKFENLKAELESDPTYLEVVTDFYANAIIEARVYLLEYLVNKTVFDFAVYDKLAVFVYAVNSFVATTFIRPAKYIFNREWLADKTLEKFIKVEGGVVKVPGFTAIKKFVIYENSILVKSKVIDHKYDFEAELASVSEAVEAIALEVSEIECSIYSECINALVSKRVAKIEEGLVLIDKLQERNRFEYSKFVSLVTCPEPSSSLGDLEVLRFDESLFTNVNGLIEIYSRLCAAKESLTTINVVQGRIINRDIFTYPLISDIFGYLFKEKDVYEKLNSLEKVTCLKWATNVLMLRYYLVCCKVLGVLSINKGSTYNDEMYYRVLLADFTVMKRWCYSMLDIAIKQHLIKRNLTIFSDIVAGFDTEYLAEDWGVNKLLSAQVSSTNFLKLKIPIFKEFKIEGVNTLTSETYMKILPKFSNTDSLLEFITNDINATRSHCYKMHDEIMLKIASYFSNNAKYQVSVTSSSVHVLLDKSAIKNLFILPAEGEELKLKFSTLIHLITEANAFREDSEINLFRLISNLNFPRLSSAIGEEKFKPHWDKESMKSKDVEELRLSNEENNSLSKAVGANAQERFQFSISPGGFLFNEGVINADLASALTNANPEEDSLSGSLAALGVSLDKGELGGWENLEEILKEKNTKVIINVNRRIYLAAHYNAADLSMLEDWKDVSHRNVDISKKCFTSLSTPIKCKKEKVYLRDTILLASATAKSLEAIAYAYNLKKVDVSQFYKENMDVLLEENPELFKEYAMTDSIITLVHALFINDFSFKLGSLNLPNTLGTLSSKYIKNKWLKDEYRGYQINVNYPLGDARASHTPKGINFGKTTLEMSNLYIGSYRGGRNECFRYGSDSSKTWYDYDLTSCYSTIMAMMGSPEYEPTELERLAALAENVMPLMGSPDFANGKWINYNEIITDEQLKTSYSAFKIKFALPKEIKYPPFPVTLDESITIYPLAGETLVTGLELLAGRTIFNKIMDKYQYDNKDYKIEIIYGSYIPFKRQLEEQPDGSKEWALAYSPFKEVISELQENRRTWKKATGKGSAMERIYKDLGNMLYGKIVCGISNKKVYDSRTLVMKTMIGNDLSNPILGTWITGFVRALIAELLFETDNLGGQVVSCTTDGFVTDIEGLEHKINATEGSLLQEYQKIRYLLSGDPSALEVKCKVKGITQWTTRGQLSNESLDFYNGKPIFISAATGYQKSKNHEENVSLVKHAMSNGNRILFLHKELSGAKDIYNTTKNVSMKTRQQYFKTVFDSKRIVIPSTDKLLYTEPFIDVSQALLDRNLMQPLKNVYSEAYSMHITKPSTNASEEVVKLFIRMISAHYGHYTTVNVKNAIANMLNSLDKKLSVNYILELFALYESEKANILDKLPVFRKSAQLVLNIYNELLNLAELEKKANLSLYKGLPLLFLETFNNFSILPRTPEARKKELLLKIESLDKNSISWETIDNKIVITINKAA